jgi:hypothetical protein
MKNGTREAAITRLLTQPPSTWRPARVSFVAPVAAIVQTGMARIGAGAWLEFAPDELGADDVLYQSFPPARVLRVEWLREEFAPEPYAGLEFT